MADFLHDHRFDGIEPFNKRVLLSSPTMHGDEEKWVAEAFRTNWVSTVGENIDQVEAQMASFVGRKYAVGLSSGTAALHMAIRLMAQKLYGTTSVHEGALAGKKVFCSDLTFAATVNPVAYEGGEAVFIDSERDSWNMSPQALEKAFDLYPDVRLIVIAHLYGTPGNCREIMKIARAHNALVVEDAAESLGSSIDGVQTGTFGDASVLSFNGNKIITGSSGGMLLTDDLQDANRVRKWSTQSREAAPWYQHEELGYNYRMSNIVAGVVRGQIPHLGEHIAQKKAIYERYKEGLRDLPVHMNPVPANCDANHWLSCLLIDEDAVCPQVRDDKQALYRTQPGKSCPSEILEALAAFNAEGRPIWKPMHMQPIYSVNPFVTAEGSGRGRSNAYIAGIGNMDAGSDLFRRGLCLPSDNKMTIADQNVVIDIIHRCFDRQKSGK